jgi:hypothetical protein
MMIHRERLLMPATLQISVAYPDPFSLIPALRLLAVLTTRLQRIAIITNHPSIKMASHAILLLLLMPVPLYTNPKTKNAQMAMTFQVVKDFLRRPATTTFEAHQADLAPAPDAFAAPRGKEQLIF